MVKIALISDLHANFEAVKAVLADIEQNGIVDIISLGDNVGYGPDPIKVLKALEEKEVFTLEGNHDLAVVDPKSFANATDLAIDAIEWTRFQICEEVKQNANFQDILANYFATLSHCFLKEDPRVLLVHGCPGDNYQRFSYLLNPEDFLPPAKYMSKKGHNICFFGHTHRQLLWEVSSNGVSVIEFKIDEPIDFTEKEIASVQLFINPGSVGQPRDYNSKAAYAIYEQKDKKHFFTFKRVAYDIKKTQEKIYSIDYLDNMLGDRLFEAR